MSTCYATLTLLLFDSMVQKAQPLELLNKLSVYIHVKCSELDRGHFSTEQQAFKNDS